MNVLLSKLKAVLSAVAPVVFIILTLSFTLVYLSSVLLLQFIIGTVAIVLGLSILLFSIEISVLPFGNHMGKSFLKSNSILHIIFIGFLLGFFWVSMSI